MPRSPAKCGTDSGYFRHHRKGEPKCPECLAAHSEAAKGYKRKNPRDRKTQPCRCGAMTASGRCPSCAQRDRFSVPREQRDDLAYTGGWKVIGGILRPIGEVA